MSTDPVALVILAGGAGRRLGGADKALLPLADDGQPLLALALARLAPWPGPLLISANGDPARFAVFGAPVLPDSVTEADGAGAGPLAGLHAAMAWLSEHRPDVAWMVSLSADIPAPPRDLLARLEHARREAGARAAVAASGGRVHNVVGLWPVAPGSASALERAMREDGLRRAGAWVARLRAARATWPAEPADPFDNINTSADLQRVRRALAMSRPGH